MNPQPKVRDIKEARLREALERTLHNFELLLAQKPVRDATETIAEARAALAPGTVHVAATCRDGQHQRDLLRRWRDGALDGGAWDVADLVDRTNALLNEPSGLAEALADYDAALTDAAQYALAYLNDPEGLAARREEWRDRLRAALRENTVGDR